MKVFSTEGKGEKKKKKTNYKSSRNYSGCSF